MKRYWIRNASPTSPANSGKPEIVFLIASGNAEQQSDHDQDWKRIHSRRDLGSSYFVHPFCIRKRRHGGHVSECVMKPCEAHVIFLSGLCCKLRNAAASVEVPKRRVTGVRCRRRAARATCRLWPLRTCP
jgi:hypothetical protein